MYTSPDPRSGWAITSIAGTSAASITRVGRLALAQSPRAVDDERRQHQDQQHLAELGRLKGEERKADRALRAIGGVAEAEHGQNAHDQQHVDPVSELPQRGVVQAREQEHAGRADDQVDRLPIDVVLGPRRYQVAGGRFERHDRADREPDHREREQRIERQAQGPGLLLRALGGLDRRRRDRSGSWRSAGSCGFWHQAQNVLEFPATNCLGLPNHCEAIRRAIGAAVSAPKPPCSTVTASRIGRLGSAM